MIEPTAKLTHYTEVPAEVFGDGAPGVSIRWMIDGEHDGAPNYALRMLEVAAGGHTPDHSHPYEHENFVIEGKGRVLIGDEWHDLSVGDVIYVPAGMRHSYANAGEATFRFLCGIPIAK